MNENNNQNDSGLSISGIMFWIFLILGIVFNAVAANQNNLGDLLKSENYNSIATIFYIIASLFLFLWLIGKLNRSSEKSQSNEIEALKQKKQIEELQKQLEELKNKEL